MRLFAALLLIAAGLAVTAQAQPPTTRLYVPLVRISASSTVDVVSSRIVTIPGVGRRLVGEVSNGTLNPVGNVRVIATLSGATPAAERTTTAYLRRLNPLQRSPFEIDLSDLANDSDYTLTVTSEVGDPTLVDLLVENINDSLISGRFEVRFTIRNPVSMPLQDMTYAVTFLDRLGNVIDVAMQTADPSTLRFNEVRSASVQMPYTVTGSRIIRVQAQARPVVATPSPNPTTAAPTPTSIPSNCAAEYPTVCIPPPPPDLNCGDITFRRFTVLPPDRHNFDTDNDGVGCESG